MNVKSLGLYDSGVGGISILTSLRIAYPNLAVTYLADQEIMPLGEKSRDYIRERLQNASEHLFERGCPIVILACNTASVMAIRYLQQTWIKAKYPGKHNVLGINKPLMEGMVERYAYLRGRKGMLISTSATYDSGYYQNELDERGFYHVQAVSSSDLASAIEAGDETRVAASVERAIAKLKVPREEIEFVILACTHYPFATAQIKSFFKPEVKIIEPGPLAANKFGDYLYRHQEYVINDGPVTYLTTGDAKEFEKKVKILTNEKITAAHVTI